MNFKLRNLNDSKIEGKNDIMIFHMSPHQEMNPRPAFKVNDSGIWFTKTLNEMDPINEIDNIIESEIKGLKDECK